MRLLLLLVILALGGSAQAVTLCPEHFAGGRPPVAANPRLGVGARALCFEAFAVLHSGATRTPLYSAERLTTKRIRAARDTPRDSSFYAEPALPPDEQATLADYARSGWDRGHLAPSGDMPNDRAQQESFSLANIVPQAPQLNRILWEGMESAIRTLTLSRGELYVVTGPIFEGAELKALNGRVVIPTHIFKAVLDPWRRQAGAYVALNVNDPDWRVVSIAELQRLTGFDVFPTLPAHAKLTALRLPAPTPTSRMSGR